jgi:hypothetical protein
VVIAATAQRRASMDPVVCVDAGLGWADRGIGDYRQGSRMVRYGASEARQACRPVDDST